MCRRLFWNYLKSNCGTKVSGLVLNGFYFYLILFNPFSSGNVEKFKKFNF